MGLNLKKLEAAAWIRQLAAATGGSVTRPVTVSVGCGVDGEGVVGERAARSVEPVTKRHAETARQASRDFGKGSGRAAGLNLGDRFAYAPGRAIGGPLRFKADDFALTEIASGLGQTTERR
jgi:hypothetical protein